MSRASTGDIDVTITWVDQSDPAWRAQKDKYDPHVDESASGDMRFRDWDQLRYVFRSIEANMDWVRRVHLVTWGHVPAWLNLNAPKLNVVRHQDFIPAEYLPTFNSNVLDLNLWRIPGLAEQFVNFNDDTFAIKPTQPQDFFQGGLPCDMACISPQPIQREYITNTEVNNLEIINDHFTMADIRRNRGKWLNPRLYGQYALRTALFMRFSTIIGIFEPHVPTSYRKSVAEHLWDIEFCAHDETCRNRFRTKLDISQWLHRQWQLLSGEFVPRTKDFGKLVSASDVEGVRQVLWKSKYKLACINDDASTDPQDFPRLKQLVNAELDRLLPTPSSFEKPH